VPMLNVMPAVTSLLMQDRADVYRRCEVVNGFGESTTSRDVTKGVPCIIWPGGQNKLDRRPEAQSTEKVIEMVSRFAFNMASDGKQADVIAWRGDEYTVTSVADYSQYGAGFTQAMAMKRPVLGRKVETK
jgi:galactose-6-phosphate isomerase